MADIDRLTLIDIKLMMQRLNLAIRTPFPFPPGEVLPAELHFHQGRESESDCCHQNSIFFWEKERERLVAASRTPFPWERERGVAVVELHFLWERER